MKRVLIVFLVIALLVVLLLYLLFPIEAVLNNPADGIPTEEALTQILPVFSSSICSDWICDPESACEDLHGNVYELQAWQEFFELFIHPTDVFREFCGYEMPDDLASRFESVSGSAIYATPTPAQAPGPMQAYETPAATATPSATVSP